MTDTGERARFDLGTLAALMSLAATCLVLLLLTFDWWVNYGAPMTGNTVLNDIVEDASKLLALMFAFAVMGTLTLAVAALVLGIEAMLRPGGKRLLAFLGTVFSAFVLLVSYFTLLLPVFGYGY